ncbi:MAG: dihydroneopterin aldolase [Chloroflexi bacterium]|nr:dihydroneopterin aldolase [Chloroflexota bacterium]
MSCPRPEDGCLEIRGLRCQSRIGAYAGEADVPRVLLVDLRAWLSLAAAADTDALVDSVDFAALSALVQAVLGSGRRALLERAASDTARALLEAFPELQAVRVRVRKPNPDGLAADEESVAMTLAR